MIKKGSVGLIPELYYLPEENIAAEKKEPHSQRRIANDNVPLVWAQSLYLTGLMIHEDLLTVDDLDPLRMRRRSRRFIQTQLALVVLAENDEVKTRLAEQGVIAETLDDVAPIQVIQAQQLVEAYARVGANPAMGLSGRPKRRLQSLSTSQSYLINGRQFLCLSWMQGGLEDYRGYDARRIALKVEQEVAHILKIGSTVKSRYLPCSSIKSPAAPLKLLFYLPACETCSSSAVIIEWVMLRPSWLFAHRAPIRFLFRALA